MKFHVVAVWFDITGNKHGRRSMGRQGDMPPSFLKWKGRLVFLSPSYFLESTFLIHWLGYIRYYLRKNVGMISVCQTSHCLCQDCVLWRYPYFNSNRKRLAQCIEKKSTYAIIRVTSYLVGREPPQESHPALGPSGIDPVPLHFNADLRPWK